MEEKITFGKFISKKRRELGLTQKELAENLYVTESAVSKWERGISYPDITLIAAICEQLKISEHELITSSNANITAIVSLSFLGVGLMFLAGGIAYSVVNTANIAKKKNKTDEKS